MNNTFNEIKNISLDANEMWTIRKSFFLDRLNKHVPITYIQVKGNKIPYVTSELKTMIRQRDYLRAKANKTGLSVLKQAYSQVRAKVHKYDLKNTWKVLKGATGKAHKTIKIEMINFEGKEFTDKKQITELCNEHFVSIGDKRAKSIELGNEQFPTAHIQPATVKFRFKPISVLQVTKVIKKLL